MSYPEQAADFGATSVIHSGKSLNSSVNKETGYLSEEPLSVLIIVEPGLDGVFRHVEGLTDFLLGKGIHVDLAYSSKRCGAGMLHLVERVRSAKGEVMDMKVGNSPGFSDFAAFCKLVGMIRRVKPRIIHAHSSKAGALARVAAMILRHKRILYSPHAYYGMSKPNSAKVWFYNLVESILGRVGITVAISRDEANFGIDRLSIRPERMRVIHNPVDTAHFSPATAEERSAARSTLGIPQEAVVLALIGRMCWQKDPETAYSGVAPVYAKNKDLVFIHLGWGEWKTYLLEHAKRLDMNGRFKIIDYTDNPKAIYQAMDALVVSSRYEAGWPLVLLEAMASDLPIVAATGLGMSDLGKAQLSHVWTFHPESVEGCTAAVEAWLSDRRAGLRECNHRQFAIDRLSPDRCYGAVLSLYSNNPSGGSISPIISAP